MPDGVVVFIAPWRHVMKRRTGFRVEQWLRELRIGQKLALLLVPILALLAASSWIALASFWSRYRTAQETVALTRRGGGGRPSDP
jgi:hypothetical protein